MDLGLTQTIKQIQTLSPQMYMSMEILCLNSLDLEERIDRELEENIALELSEGPKAEGEGDAGDASTAEGTAATLEAGVGEPSTAVAPGEESAADAFDRKVEQWDSFARDEYDFEPGPRSTYDGDKDEKLEALNNTEGRPMSLQEYLEQQVHLLDAGSLGPDPEMILDLATAIIYNIDDRGYLMYSPEEIYESLSLLSPAVLSPAVLSPPVPPGGAVALSPPVTRAGAVGLSPPVPTEGAVDAPAQPVPAGGTVASSRVMTSAGEHAVSPESANGVVPAVASVLSPPAPPRGRRRHRELCHLACPEERGRRRWRRWSRRCASAGRPRARSSSGRSNWCRVSILPGWADGTCASAFSSSSREMDSCTRWRPGSSRITSRTWATTGCPRSRRCWASRSTR